MVEGAVCPDNKELYLISVADHTDFYDGGKDKVIPFAKIVDFFQQYLK